jgi:cytochrome c oxidase cbb3-type subunit 3
MMISSYRIWRDYRFWTLAALCIVLGGALLAWRQVQDERLEVQMLTLLPDEVPQRPDLVRLAAAEGKSAYAGHCASCHGADMKGNRRLGAPDLSDRVWLYGSGDVTDIERTILYGIRSGHGQAHNVTEMTAFGLTGMLTDGEIKDVVQYVLSLNHRPNLAEAALAGRAIFYGKGSCYDCHGPDARGDPDYGSSDLTINVWNNGGDPASLYRSVYDGIDHSCPAWYGKIPLAQIRALAVYLYSVSHSGTGPASRAPGYAPRAS